MEIKSTTRLYQATLLMLAAISPTLAIWYIIIFSGGVIPRFENHLFHECAIFIATIEGAFVSYISWRSYKATGEIFVRWLTAGFLVFTLIYAPHGLLTRASHYNIWLFLLYGPVSRLVMLLCLVYGLLQYGNPPENPDAVERSGFWRASIAFCALVIVGVAVLAFSSIAGSPWVRKPMEGAAAMLCLGALAVMAWRRIRSPLMIYYAVALLLFAQAAAAFLLAKPWDHVWWLAHLIFAAGFSVLSWGVANALLTTRLFAHAYSAEQLMRALERERAQLADTVDALQRSDAHLKSIFDASPDTLLISDETGKVTMANQQVTRLLGYTVDELIGQSVDILVPARFRRNHPARRAEYVSFPSSRPMGMGLEVSACRKDGIEIPVEISLSQIAMGQNMLVASAVRDITERKKLEEELRLMAFNDPLTKLPNRRLFYDRLKHSMEISERKKSYGALLFLDLNKFKQLNDTHGHEVGDLLLIEVANRLRQAVRATDTVARLGGDEFVVLLEDLNADLGRANEFALATADKIRRRLTEEYIFGEIRHRGSASIGIKLFLGNNHDPDQIIKDADSAMYQDKRGKSSKSVPVGGTRTAKWAQDEE